MSTAYIVNFGFGSSGINHIPTLGFGSSDIVDLDEIPYGYMRKRKKIREQLQKREREEFESIEKKTLEEEKRRIDFEDIEKKQLRIDEVSKEIDGLISQIESQASANKLISDKQDMEAMIILIDFEEQLIAMLIPILNQIINTQNAINAYIAAMRSNDSEL